MTRFPLSPSARSLPCLALVLAVAAILLSAGSAAAQTSTSSAETTFICGSNNHTCQVLRYEDLDTTSGTVYFTGGGMSGSPTMTHWRCGSSFDRWNYIEVYVNDPNFTWPTYCISRFEGTLYLSSSNRYDFKAPGISGGGATVWPFRLEEPRLVAPSDLTVSRPNNVELYWTDNSWGETGYEVQRRPLGVYPDPRPVYSYGVMGVYAPYWHSSLHSQLAPSAQRFCIEEGYLGYKEFDVSGPIGSVHSWWNGSSWQTSGNNTVFYVTDLTCYGSWSQRATLGANATSYQDSAPLEWFDYRVRALRYSQTSPFSNVATIDDVVCVCGEGD